MLQINSCHRIIYHYHLLLRAVELAAVNAEVRVPLADGQMLPFTHCLLGAGM